MISLLYKRALDGADRLNQIGMPFARPVAEAR